MSQAARHTYCRPLSAVASNMVQIRDVIAEDLEAVFAGKETAAAGLGDAVNRGNALLRQFQRTMQ